MLTSTIICVPNATKNPSFKVLIFAAKPAQLKQLLNAKLLPLINALGLTMLDPRSLLSLQLIQAR